MLIPIDRAIIDARNIKAAAEQTVSGNDFILQHNNRAILRITVSGSTATWTSDATTPIADGNVVGQLLKIVIVSVGDNKLILRDSGNCSLNAGDWKVDNTQNVLTVYWNGTAWVEIQKLPFGSSRGYNSLALMGCIASGDHSFAVGWQSTASGKYAYTSGAGNVASNNNAYCVGYYCDATSYYSFAHGAFTLASGVAAVVLGGYDAIADHRSEFAHGGGDFGSSKRSQYSRFILRKTTTDATATEATIDDTSNYITMTAEHTYALTITAVARSAAGNANAMFKKTVLIERTGSTTQLVGAVQNLGTDINPDGYGGLTITADDVNDKLKVEVTGKAATTVNWTVIVEAAIVGK